MISPYKIQWNQIMSTEIPFDIITQCSFDGDSGDSETFLGREAVVSETYNGAMQKGSTYKWNESFAPTITIIKKDFSDFTREENRYILSWLTSKQSPGFLDIYIDDSETIEYSILGNWTSVKQYKLGNSRIVGYICQFTSLTPYAFSRLYSITKNMSDPMDNQLTITIDTDEPESVIYPRVTIQQGADSIVKVDHEMVTQDNMIDSNWIDGTIYYYEDKDEYYYNNDEGIPTAMTGSYPKNNDQKTSVVIMNSYGDVGGGAPIHTLKNSNNSTNEKVIIDGANRVISSSATSRIFGNDFNWEWLPLVNGINNIKVIGNCTVTFEYREPRKIGEY